jgi:predicted secreted protein
MAITTAPYLQFMVRQMNGNAIDLDTDTIKLALVTSSYTPNLDTHDFWDDVSANEVASGNGYTTGGPTLATAAVTGNTTSDRAEADYSVDPSWTFTATKSFRYGVVYKSTGTNSTSPLIGLIDFGATRDEAGLFTIAISSGGLIQFRAAPQTM